MAMTHYFYANAISNSEKRNWRSVLDREVVLWLSKNLRKRPIDNGRRYDYLKSSELISTRTFRKKQKRKTYNYGVRIYNEEDAMAFKLRWL